MEAGVDRGDAVAEVLVSHRSRLWPGWRGLDYHRGVSVPAGHTWTCPGCGRQVPQRVDACHCGTSREQALAVQQMERAARGPRPPRARGGLARAVALAAA